MTFPNFDPRNEDWSLDPKRLALWMLLGDEVKSADPFADFLIYDTFTDDNDVAIENHTPEKGGVWSVQEGTAAEFKIASDQLLINLSTGTNHSQAIIDAGQADVKIEVKMTLAGNNPQVHLRVNEDGGGAPEHGLYINPSVSANKLRIFKYDGGFTNIGETVQVYAASDVIELVILLSGDSISAEDITNSVTAVATNSFQQAETWFGIGENNGNNGVKFAHFFVSPN